MTQIHSGSDLCPLGTLQCAVHEEKENNQKKNSELGEEKD